MLSKSKYIIFGIVIISFLGVLNYSLPDDNLVPASNQDVTDPQKIELAKDSYNLALAAYKEKNYERSCDYLSKAISFYPNYTEAYALLGNVYYSLKEEERAYESYKKCIELIDKSESPSDDISKLRAEILPKIEKILVLDAKISVLDKEFVARILELGMESMQREDYLLAEETFLLILKIDANNTEVSDNLQKVKNILAQNDGSNNYEIAKAYYQSGLLLFNQNKYDEAIEKFNKALSTKKDFVEALFKLGECYENTKDTIQAIINYRLCLKSLESKKELVQDEKNILTSAKRNLDKIDVKGKEFKIAKEKYVAELLKTVNEYASKKYLNCAVKLYRKILSVDPVNKAASDGLAKVRNDMTQKAVGSKKERLIFSGEDMSGWDVNSIWLPLWSVDKPFLVFNRTSRDQPSLIEYKTAFPENYILAFELILEKRLPITGYEVGICYGQSSNEGKISLQIVNTIFSKLNNWEKIRFTFSKQDMTFKLEEGSKVTKKGKLEVSGVYKIGINARGYIAKFRNITLLDLDQ
ncbi:MAG: tetratricopeptide repeat protein [Planctomycetota bacterium]